ncbi:hypothetical protein HGM15179_014985 [Zosterops borbonicus]|uniref:Uncharacterized protein n=1 Tax=Zosterops borbonicus TaxID=364589 RepID=A0A8K1LFR5_9PASS|nr:hypothetical protein HGM15179_014985 [Zosterops borbonicus]
MAATIHSGLPQLSNKWHTGPGKAGPIKIKSRITPKAQQTPQKAKPTVSPYIHKSIAGIFKSLEIWETSLGKCEAYSDQVTQESRRDQQKGQTGSTDRTKSSEFQTKTLANLDKNHFLANARKKFLHDNDTNLINPLAIPSALSIRLTHEIDIRKSFSRNETMRPDEIREGHRKEIRTIQPILDTWTA